VTTDFALQVSSSPFPFRSYVRVRDFSFPFRYEGEAVFPFFFLEMDGCITFSSPCRRFLFKVPPPFTEPFLFFALESPPPFGFPSFLCAGLLFQIFVNRKKSRCPSLFPFPLLLWIFQLDFALPALTFVALFWRQLLFSVLFINTPFPFKTREFFYPLPLLAGDGQAWSRLLFRFLKYLSLSLPFSLRPP